MIKINLLPAYVLEKSLVRRTVILVAIIVLAQVAALAFAYLQIGSAQKEADARLKLWTDKANEVATIVSQASGEKSAAVPYQSWVTFVDEIHKNNAKWAWLYEEIAKWVDNRVVLRTISLSGQTVTLQGATDSIESAKRWYLNSLMSYLYSDVKLQVQVPGWTAAPGGGGQTMGPARGAAGPTYAGVTGPIDMTPPSERTPVSLACTVKPQFLFVPPAPPGGGGGPGGPPAAGGGGGVSNVAGRGFFGRGGGQ